MWQTSAMYTVVPVVAAVCETAWPHTGKPAKAPKGGTKDSSVEARASGRARKAKTVSADFITEDEDQVCYISCLAG